MPPSVDEIRERCPEVPAGFLRAHLEALEEAYFQRFDADAIGAQMRALHGLTASEPAEVLTRRWGRRGARVTVLAFDRAFAFSLIAGVLAGLGFRVRSGDVFTVRAQEDGRSVGRIIDHFEGEIEDDEPFEPFAERLAARIKEVLALNARDDEGAREEAKNRVNEQVTARLAETPAPARRALYPVQIETEQLERRTRLRITAEDTPAFLYGLSTALALHGLSIERLRIGGAAGTVEDEIDVVDERGEPVTDPSALERIKLSVGLTKQFTLFLPRAPDPTAALQRFAQLVERAQDLPEESRFGDPRAMSDLARLLGASDFLWEDFIRSQYELLTPVLGEDAGPFAHPVETLGERMDKALEGAVGLAEQRDRLNTFKNEEIFRIELDHILTPGSDFGEMSERLTALAEHLVARAARLIHADLEHSYGKPPRGAAYAVFGLGKLGGVALGYASDIELMVVYQGEGETPGNRRAGITVREFYTELVRDLRHFIKTKREGIFAVDLRLRPYGADGPLAVSRDLFERYYGPGGKAHVFERLALVRLRAIGGNRTLGETIEHLRDRDVYEGEEPDLDALWDVWEQQHRQKVRPGERNAKYSPGALVDLETTVVLLQVLHGGQRTALRTPRVREALSALRDARVIRIDEGDELIAAYRFLRRLINGLRMLRGTAEDLRLPEDDAEELLHLARRLGYEQRRALPAPGARVVADFESYTGGVRAFIERRFGRPCPGTGSQAAAKR